MTAEFLRFLCLEPAKRTWDLYAVRAWAMMLELALRRDDWIVTLAIGGIDIAGRLSCCTCLLRDWS